MANVEEFARELTTLQRKTVQNVVSGMSQRQAYYAAGGKARNDKTADNCVSVMMANAKVKGYYNALMSEIDRSAIMSKQEALERLTAIARASIMDVIANQNGQWVIRDDIPKSASAAVKSVSSSKYGIRLEMYDACAAIKQLSEIEQWRGDPSPASQDPEIKINFFRSENQQDWAGMAGIGFSNKEAVSDD